MDSPQSPRKPGFLSALTNKFNLGVISNIFSLGILGVSGLLLSFLVVHFQNAESVGVFNQVYAIYIIVSQIGVGGLQFSVLNHVSHHQKEAQVCSDITLSALFLTTVFGSVFSVVTYLLANTIGGWLQSPEVALGLKLVAPGILFFSLNKLLLNVINGKDRIKSVASFRSARAILLVVFVLAGLLYNLSSGWLCFAFTAAEAVLLPAFLIHIARDIFPLHYSNSLWKWVRPHLSFGMRGMMSGVLIELNTRIDVLMLGYFSSDMVVGIYSYVSILAESFSQIPLALRTSIDPLVGGYFAEAKTGEINRLAASIKKKFYPLILGAGLIVVLAFPLLHQVWIHDNHLSMSWITLTVIMVGVIINAAYRPFSGILLQGGRPGTYTFVIVVLLVSDALLNLIFIPMWGIYAAAAVTCFTYIFEAGLLVVFAKRLFRVDL